MVWVGGYFDEIAKEHRDPLTSEIYPCFDSFNTDDLPETKNSIKIVHALTSQSAQTEIITTFINMVESGILRLLVKKSNEDSLDYSDENKELLVQHMHTDLLIEEISNLKLKELPSKKLTVERVVRRIDKDRWAALVYGLWYIKTYMERIEEEVDMTQYIAVSQGSNRTTQSHFGNSQGFQGFRR